MVHVYLEVFCNLLSTQSNICTLSQLKYWKQVSSTFFSQLQCPCDLWIQKIMMLSPDIDLNVAQFMRLFAELLSNSHRFTYLSNERDYIFLSSILILCFFKNFSIFLQKSELKVKVFISHMMTLCIEVNQSGWRWYLVQK